MSSPQIFMTDVAYPELTEIEIAFKTVIWTPMIKAGEIWLEGAVPFLALPVIKQLDEFTIEQISDALFNQIIVFIDVNAIKLKNAQMQAKWTTEAEALSLIATEQGADSDAYKKALSDAATDFANWIHTGPK